VAESQVSEALAGLIEKVQSGRLRDRRAAAQELCALGKEATPALPALASCLTEEDAALRIYAADALANIGPAAVPELITVLRSRYDEARQAAVRALSVIDPQVEDVVPTLVNCLRDIDVTVRLDAAAALVRAGKPAVPYLISGLRDEDPSFRKACCITLGGIGRAAKPALAALTEALANGRLGHEANDAIRAIQGNLLAVIVRFTRDALIKSHLTIVILLLFGVLLITVVWLADKVLDVSMAVVAVTLSWGVIGTCFGAALGYSTRWRRLGAVLGAVVLGLGSAVSGALVGETFIRISEGVVRGFPEAAPKATEKDKKAGQPDRPGAQSSSNSPAPRP
jgi:hypothetical protein